MEGEPRGIEGAEPVAVPLAKPAMPSPIKALCYTLASCGDLPGDIAAGWAIGALSALFAWYAVQYIVARRPGLTVRT